MSLQEITDFIIIGAGMAGLTAAHALKKAGRSVIVLEKSRGISGRMATRQTPFGKIDHGAQYVTTTSDAFLAQLHSFEKLGSAAKWTPNGKDRSRDWYCGINGMVNMIAPLAEGLDIRFGETVTSLVRTEFGITLKAQDDTGIEQDFHANHVIIAIPTPQAIRLVKDHDAVFDALDKVTYWPCYAGLFAFEKPLKLDADIHRGNDEIGFIVRANSKPKNAAILPAQDLIMVHAAQDYSLKHLETDKHDMVEPLRSALQNILGDALPAPLYARAHRWRFAQVDQALGTPFLATSDMRIAAIGDGMLGGRVEAAFLSAHGLIEELGYSRFS